MAILVTLGCFISMTLFFIDGVVAATPGNVTPGIGRVNEFLSTRAINIKSDFIIFVIKSMYNTRMLDW